MKVKSEGEVAQSCLTHCDPMDCSLPGSSVHGIFQARVLERGAIAFSGLCHINTTTIDIAFIATATITAPTSIATDTAATLTYRYCCFTVTSHLI